MSEKMPVQIKYPVAAFAGVCISVLTLLSVAVYNLIQLGGM